MGDQQKLPPGSASYSSESLLPPPKAALLLGIRSSTLANWRCAGKGPAYCRIGRRIAYRFSDLQAFIVGGRVCTDAAEDRELAILEAELYRFDLELSKLESWDDVPHSVLSHYFTLKDDVSKRRAARGGGVS